MARGSGSDPRYRTGQAQTKVHLHLSVSAEIDGILRRRAEANGRNVSAEAEKMWRKLLLEEERAQARAEAIRDGRGDELEGAFT